MKKGDIVVYESTVYPGAVEEDCVPVLEQVSRLRPRLVGYLSCNPETLARDLAALVERGLVVAEVTPLDMLPHTSHVEALALLRGT